MKFHWDIETKDIEKLKQFVANNQNPFVDAVIARNVKREYPPIDKDTFIKSIFMCLLTSQQPSGPNTKVGLFFQLNPFPFTYKSVSSCDNIENLIQQTLLDNGLNRFINKIPNFFLKNYKYLETTKWQLFADIQSQLNGQHSKEIEREVADFIDDIFKGFGPKQSRNFLQSLGLTKYEVPLDSRIIRWMHDFGFPIKLSSSALQDKVYYHFILDGFQALCEKAEIYPCVVDASIFSSYDNGEWTTENIIY